MPDGWALDQSGQPTTDPALAIDGLLRPIGDFKGANLALVMGVLSSMLSGAAYGTQLGDMYAGPAPARTATSRAPFASRPSKTQRASRPASTRPSASSTPARLAPGYDRVYAPGELEFLNEAANRRDGILLTCETIDDLVGSRSLGRCRDC